jgi:hypothetical protein
MESRWSPGGLLIQFQEFTWTPDGLHQDAWLSVMTSLSFSSRSRQSLKLAARQVLYSSCVSPSLWVGVRKSCIACRIFSSDTLWCWWFSFSASGELVLFEFRGEWEHSSSSSSRAHWRRSFAMQASLSSQQSSLRLRSLRSDPSRSSPASEDSGLGLLSGDRIELCNPPTSSNGVSVESWSLESSFWVLRWSWLLSQSLLSANSRLVKLGTGSSPVSNVADSVGRIQLLLWSSTVSPRILPGASNVVGDGPRG